MLISPYYLPVESPHSWHIMWHSETADIHCPYCGEPIEVVVDPSVNEQSYVEDCWVCCRPMTLSVIVEQDGTVTVQPAREDD